ncbi:MAG: radical SAM protein [bacterium]
MKKLRVLLLNPVAAGSLQTPFPVLPLGIALNAAIAHAFECELRVLFGQNLHHSLQNLLRTWTPDCAGFQTFVNTMTESHKLAGIIRKAAPNAFIVFGGVEASNNPETALRNSTVNGVITGEGEMQFRLLLERLTDNPYESPGLIHRADDGSLITNPGKCLYENLDDLPEIPYELFYGSGKVPVGHILTHRGCPFHCSHCPLRFRDGVPIRSHSAARIIGTIEHLHQRFGVRHIEFFDENFTMDPNHVSEICQGIQSVPVTFSCTARISQVNIDLCREMAEAGCRQIIFGLGTGVPRLQSILGTHEDLDHARQLFVQLAETSIQPLAVFSLGIPTETRSELRQTVRYACNLKKCAIRFEPAAPLPGSQLYHTAGKSGHFLIDSWDNYRRPGQVVYIPEGWTVRSFYTELYKAKLAARLKLVRSKFTPAFLRR